MNAANPKWLEAVGPETEAETEALQWMKCEICTDTIDRQKGIVSTLLDYYGFRIREINGSSTGPWTGTTSSADRQCPDRLVSGLTDC